MNKSSLLPAGFSDKIYPRSQKNAMITFPSLEDLKQAYQDLREEIRQRVSKKMT